MEGPETKAAPPKPLLCRIWKRYKQGTSCVEVKRNTIYGTYSKINGMVFTQTYANTLCVTHMCGNRNLDNLELCIRLN